MFQRQQCVDIDTHNNCNRTLSIQSRTDEHTYKYKHAYTNKHVHTSVHTHVQVVAESETMVTL